MHTLKSSLSRYLLYPGSFKYIIAMIVCVALTSILGGMLPIYMSDLSIHYGEKELFLKTLKILAVIFVTTFLNRGLYNVIINSYVVHLVQFVRVYCYEKWLLSYELQTSKENRTDRYPQGEVLARIMTDTEALRELVTSGTFGILIDLFFVFSSLISFITLNQFAGISLAIVQVLACAVLIWGSKYMREVFMDVRKARGSLYKTIADVIGGVRENYYIENGKFASKRSLIVFEKFLDRILMSNVWDASYYSMAESLFPIFLAFAVFIIPKAEMVQVGLIFAFVDLIQRSIGPIKDVSSKIANIQRAASGVVRINEFIYDLEHEKTTDLNSEAFNFDVLEFSVEVKKFIYPTRPNQDSVFLLQNIGFNAKRGDLIGIVGLSGSGKSTFLNILCANIIADEAFVKIKNSQGDLFEFDFHDAVKFNQYRQIIGIVSQDSHVFSESLHYNITMGKSDNEDFDTFWKSMQDQIPYLSEWGITKETKLDQNALSLGQKQLVSAIRSCYLKKSIVLFDEISSSLDSNLEYALRQMVLLVQKNALTIIVAHRLETIIEADLILVLKNGELVGRDKHNTLLKESDEYRSFVEKLT